MVIHLYHQHYYYHYYYQRQLQLLLLCSVVSLQVVAHYLAVVAVDLLCVIMMVNRHRMIDVFLFLMVMGLRKMMVDPLLPFLFKKRSYAAHSPQHIIAQHTTLPSFFFQSEIVSEIVHIPVFCKHDLYFVRLYSFLILTTALESYLVMKLMYCKLILSQRFNDRRSHHRLSLNVKLSKPEINATYFT